MRMRTGRLAAGYFDRRTDPDFMAEDWSEAFRGMTNTAWFAVDTEAGTATEVNFRDFYASTGFVLMGYLEGDEAVAVVSEGEMLRWASARQENRGAWGTRPVVLAIEELVQMASFLVTREKVYVLGSAVTSPDPRVAHVSHGDVPALFADH